MSEERRIDLTTSESVADAFRIQRKLGFEPAFLSLRAHGVSIELARELLEANKDRRASVQPKATSLE